MTDVRKILILGPQSAGKTVLLDLLLQTVHQELGSVRKPLFKLKIPDSGEGFREAMHLQSESNNGIQFYSGDGKDKPYEAVRKRGKRILEGGSKLQSEHFHSYVMRFIETATNISQDVLLVDHPGGQVFLDDDGANSEDVKNATEPSIASLCGFASTCDCLVICFPVVTSGDDQQAQSHWLRAMTDRIQRIVDACEGKGNLKRIIVAFTKAEADRRIAQSICRHRDGDFSHLSKLIVKPDGTREIELRIRFLEAIYTAFDKSVDIALAAVSAMGIVNLEDKRYRPNWDVGHSKMEFYTNGDPSRSYITLGWRALHLWQIFHFSVFGGNLPPGVISYQDVRRV